MIGTVVREVRLGAEGDSSVVSALTDRVLSPGPEPSRQSQVLVAECFDSPKHGKR